MGERRRFPRVELVSAVRIQSADSGGRNGAASISGSRDSGGRNRAASPAPLNHLLGIAGPRHGRGTSGSRDPGIPQLIAWGNDLSEGGIGVETNGPLSMREGIALQITVPGSRVSISAKGQVIWKEPPPGLRTGIQFHHLETLAKAQIRHLLTDQLAHLARRRPARSVFGSSPQPVPRIRWSVPLSVVAVAMGGMLFFGMNSLERSVESMRKTLIRLRVEKIELQASMLELQREVAILNAFQEARRKTEEASGSLSEHPEQVPLSDEWDWEE